MTRRLGSLSLMMFASVSLAGCLRAPDNVGQTSQAFTSSCDPARAAGVVPTFQRVLLDLIATTEGTKGHGANDGYDVGFDFVTIPDCTVYPDQVYDNYSSAAGRYQFLDTTWCNNPPGDGTPCRSFNWGHPNFYPNDQDQVAMALVTQKRGVSVPADRPFTYTEFVSAMDALSYEWASLPPGRYGQPAKSMDQAWSIYNDLASTAGGNAPPPAPPPSGTLPNCNESTISAYAPVSAQPFFNEAWQWVNNQVSYCECITGNAVAGPYRSDCSGFISSVWSLPSAGGGDDTYQLASGPQDNHESVVISGGWSSITAGDAVNFAGDINAGTGHVMLFGGWLDDAHTKFCAIDEPHKGAVAEITTVNLSDPGTWYLGPSGTTVQSIFVPIRKAGYTPSGTQPQLPPPPGNGYRIAVVPTKDGNGYWQAATDGGVFSYGSAKFYGSMGNVKLAQPVVGMARTPTGNGYWLVAADGGIFAFGDAHFFGSLGNIALNMPIVGMTPTPSGNGYWLVGADGGVFSFGDAHFYGSTGNITLAQPVVGIAATPSGQGYWLAAADGGVFSFGDAQFLGSLANDKLNKPISSIVATPSGNGYRMAGQDGGVFGFGDGAYYGSLGNQSLVYPVNSIALDPLGGYYLLDEGGKAYLFRAGACGAHISSPADEEYVDSPAGIHEVQGAIRAEWDALGADCSMLGFPTSDEANTQCGGGRFNDFQGGEIQWTASTGAHETHGAIHAKYVALDYECGFLGFPTSNEYGIAIGRRNDFQGGFIVYNSSSGVASGYGWPASPTSCGSIPSGHGLRPGASVSSCDGRYTLLNQSTDGNIVLFHNGVGPIWSTATNPRASTTFVMQGDGNLVVYDNNELPVWSSGTPGRNGAWLAVQTDGNLVIYGGGCTGANGSCWASGTSGR